MKLKNILLTAVAALVSIASANATNTWTSGDVLFGISNSADGNDTYIYNVDLGSISDLLSLSATGGSKTWQLSTSDMNSILGSGWADSDSVSWGVASTYNGTSNKSIWATAATDANVVNLSTISLNTAFTQLSNTISTYVNGTALTTTDSNIVSAAEVVQASSSTTWSAENSGASSFKKLTLAVAALDDSTSSSLGLYSYDSTATAGSTATLLGTFTLSDSGTLTYEAVPEPSTYAMLGIGGLAMLRMFRRRRSA
ncbi:MAG: PEP-CTERM sorting domain-containing protein [Chthoniobacteraceae bacterium]